jgi:hypothetical protein
MGAPNLAHLRDVGITKASQLVAVVFAVVLAFLSVIPEGNLLLPFQRSASSNNPQRTGSTYLAARSGKSTKPDALPKQAQLPNYPGKGIEI